MLGLERSGRHGERHDCAQRADLLVSVVESNVAPSSGKKKTKLVLIFLEESV